MKTAELKPILIDFLSWWQRNTQDASEPNEDWMDETTVDSYLSTYKNQSQPIEKYLPIESIVKEVIEVCKCHAESGCFDYEGAEANALRTVRALWLNTKPESSPTEQPEK